MPDAAVNIDVARQFSAYPSGRSDRDGPYNATRFRNEFLLPALKAAIGTERTVVVTLDGVRSFGSSFLEESFGGLVREGLTKADLDRHLRVQLRPPGNDRYLTAIKRYIDRAS